VAAQLRFKSLMLSVFLLGAGGWIFRSVKQASWAASVAQWAAAAAVVVGLSTPIALAVKAFMKDIKR
jgi:uncharacterized membrane protein